MASPSDPHPPPSLSSYGAGGKLRSRRPSSLARKKTPYDRPLSGRYAAPSAPSPPPAASAAHASMASRLVGSASRVISSSASYLFSSIFRRLPLPIANGDPFAGVGQKEDIQEDSAAPSDEGDQGLAIVEGRQTSELETLEFEEILRQKTLSREQFNRLTEILQARVVDSTADGKRQLQVVEDKGKGDLQQDSQLVTVPLPEAQRWREERKKAWDEKENELQEVRLHGNANISGSKILDGESTPIEVARAYMGDRSARTPGLSLSVRSRLYEPVVQVSSKAADFLKQRDGILEDRYRTPPAVKTLARVPGTRRTPYSRPQLPPAPNMLKRRSSAMDDSWGSFGPIRRTRHKSLAMATPSNFSRGPVASTSNAPLLASASPVDDKGRSFNTPNKLPSENDRGKAGALLQVNKDDKKKLLSGLAFVPVQSSETARKILETLEKMTPSPKGKSLEEELAFVRERAPTELTPGMLNEHARKSMQVVEFPVLPVSGELGLSNESEKKILTVGFSAGGTMKQVNSDGQFTSPPVSFSAAIENASVALEAPKSYRTQDSIADGPTKEAKLKVKQAVYENLLVGSDRTRGFRMSAVFGETNSDDEGQPSLRVPTLTEPPSKSSQTVSFSGSGAAMAKTSPFISEYKPTVSQAEVSVIPSDTASAASPESISKSGSLGFTFPPPGGMIEPPTPKPIFFSSSGTTPSTLLPVYQFGAASSAGKGPVFTFAGTTSPEQTATKPTYEFKYDSKPGLSFSPSVASTTTTLEDSVFGHSFSDTKASTSAAQNTPLQGATSFSSPFSLFSASSSDSTSISFSGLSQSTGASMKSGVRSVFDVSGTVSTTVTTSAGVAPVSFSFVTASSRDAQTSFSVFGTASSGEAQASSAFGSASSGEAQTSSSVLSFSHSPNVASTVVSSPFPFGSNSTIPGVNVSAPPFSSSSLSFGGSSNPSAPFFGEATSSTFGLSGATSALAAASTTAFGTAGSSFGGVSTPAFGLANTPVFGATTTSLFGVASSPVFGTASSSLFNAASSSPFGASSSPAFGSTSAPAFGTASVSAFGSSSAPSFATATTKPFGIFSGDSASQTIAPSASVFGSGFQAPSTGFGTASSAASFSFGGGLASVATGSTFSFGSSGGMPIKSFPFGAKESTAQPQHSIFGSTPFGSTPAVASGDVGGNDQMNMEDSMAEEPSQVLGSVSPQPQNFVAASPAPAPFMFGAQSSTSAAGQSVFAFNAQPNVGASNPFSQGATAPNPFAQPAGLDFSGGAFALGTTGEKSGRKFFKARRAGSAKRGK